MPTLFVVATPIGNLEEITLRALRVLKEVTLIAAEDTRTTRKLLAHYHITTPVTSLFEHNERRKTPFLLQRLTEGDVALVSEAGMPGISDPGQELVSAAIQHGIPVVPISGPSAITTALAISGLPTDRFLYLGFLPRRRSERRRLLAELTPLPYTLVAFEAPHRLQASLQDMVNIWGDNRSIAVCRELTKLHEEIFRGSVAEALAHFSQPRGEFTLIIQGNRAPCGEETEKSVAQTLQEMQQAGLSFREVEAHLSDKKLPRRTLYRLWLQMKQTKPGAK